jgi:hypothetical protein
MGQQGASAVAARGSEDHLLLDEGIQEAELLLQSILCTKRRISTASVAKESQSMILARPSKRHRTQRDNKTVKFATDTTVCILDVQGEVDDCENLWYQQHEYQRIKEENRETLRALSGVGGKITDIDAAKYCVRGLELQVRVLLLQLPFDNRQKKVVESVLSMQRMQRKCGRNDHAAIREMSLVISKSDKLKAWRTAMVDAQR